MSEILFPSQYAVWSFRLEDDGTITEGSTIIDDPIAGNIIVAGGSSSGPSYLGGGGENADEDSLAFILDDSNRLTLKTKGMTKRAKLELYTVPFEPFSTAEHKTLQMYLKTSFPPSFFKKYEFFLEDAQGNRRVYGVRNENVGMFSARATEMFTEVEDFNPSFIAKAGFIIAEPKKDIRGGFVLYLSELSLSELTTPTYCKPQDVIRFIGMLDNHGRPLLLTQESSPSYEDLCNHIIEAEAHIDAQTKTSFKINRELQEMHDEPLAANLAYGGGMFGLYRMGGGTPPLYGGQLFEGVPVPLVRQNMKAIDYSLGDLVEVRRMGDLWDVVTEDRLWFDLQKGIVYIKDYFHRADSSVRVTYRWGQDRVPSDITKCCKLIASKAIIATDWYRSSFPISPDFSPLKIETMNSWVWEIKDILKGYQTQISVGGL